MWLRQIETYTDLIFLLFRLLDPKPLFYWTDPSVDAVYKVMANKFPHPIFTFFLTQPSRLTKYNPLKFPKENEKKKKQIAKNRQNCGGKEPTNRRPMF